MVSFELGKEIERDVFFVYSWAWDNEKILSPHEESNVIVREHRSAESEGLRFDSSWGLRIFFFVPRSWQDEKKTSFTLPQDSFVLTTELIM